MVSGNCQKNAISDGCNTVVQLVDWIGSPSGVRYRAPFRANNDNNHGGNALVFSPLKVAARGTGRMSIAPTVSTMQRFLINRKLTIRRLISLFRILSTMLMLVATVMKRMMRMSEHWRACKINPEARPNFTRC